MRERLVLPFLIPVVVGGLAACASTPEAPQAGPSAADRLHDADDLPLYEGARSTLRSDLPPPDAEQVLARLDALEQALDVAFTFLPAGVTPPHTIVIGQPARFALHAKEHGIDRPAGAFLCGRGELFAQHEEEAAADDVAVPLEPLIRPLASAAFRRRLVSGFGADLPATWLEDGLAMVFVDLMASERARPRLQLQVRERLLDAYLPLYLGGPPGLGEVISAQGDAEKRRHGSSALAWAACRFLLDDADRTRLLVTALRHHAGALDGPTWDDARARFAALEPAFETWLRDRVHVEILVAIVEAPTPVDRWEAAAALRLLANIDIDADLPADERVRAVDVTRQMLAAAPVPTRFLTLFEGEFQRVRAARSKLQAMARLRAVASKEFERRAKGYGHPAVEAARRGLGGALQRELESDAP